MLTTKFLIHKNIFGKIIKLINLIFGAIKMKNLWCYDKQGQCVVNDARSLKQPLIHMIANSPKYFSKRFFGV